MILKQNIKIARELIKLANEIISDDIKLQIENIGKQIIYNFIYNNQKIGFAQVNIDYYDNILNEYMDSVDDLNINLSLDINEKIANIEQFHLSPEYRGLHLASPCLKKVLNELNKRTNHIILRAYPDDGGLSLNNLIGFYRKNGFKTLQSTNNDGQIMYK